ncbi:NepR family anti-sigma factor [Devosia pacifica]|uniref:NepR family anti-sigma factor n=1 Tax=Devosia pacifica TaxID=1335967 RepID=UPI00167222CC|nr:NepR family anti-sigma factor [Devosia pacifica]
MLEESSVSQRRTRAPSGRTEDGLGTNSDIGSRLRALYGSVQEESVPDHLLDLLERLDQAESTQRNKSVQDDGE